MATKKIIISNLIGVFVTIVTLFTQLHEVNAAKTANIAISPVYPSNQIRQNGIFDLKVGPGQKQTIKLKVVNLSNDSQQVVIKTTNAYTSDAGVLSIDQVKVVSEQKPSVKFNHLVAEKNRKRDFVIPANKTVEVPITFTTPVKTFPGVVVGGVLVQAKKTDNPLTHKGVGLKSKFAYTMAVVLKEDDKFAKPDLLLGKVSAGRFSDAIAIKSVIKNVKPAVVSGMTINATITEKKSAKVMGKTHKTGLSMAPNSSFRFTNNWAKKSIQPGDYHYKAKISTEDGQKFLLETDFTISVADVAVINDHNNPWIKWAVALIALTIINLSVWFFSRRRRAKKTDA